jgi:predicted phage replisome organizer
VWLLAEVEWIKLTTDMFDNRKIKHLRKLPEGNNIVLIWVMLLTMAGRCNSGGMIFLTENIPYTPKMLADELEFEETTVQLALTALENFNMIVTNKGYFKIAGWEEYQNIEGMDKIREQNRIRQAKYKARQKALPGNVTDNVTVTEGNATEEDKEEEKDIDIDKENKREKTDFQSVVDLFHKICVSYPRIRSLSEARKKAINARLKNYSIDDFKTVFENAEASSFLKGSNDRNWSANFDWLIADKNMAKVLEGNYADKQSRYGRKEQVPGWLATGFQPGEAEQDAIKRLLQEENQVTQQEIDQLERELRESFGRKP